MRISNEQLDQWLEWCDGKSNLALDLRDARRERDEAARLLRTLWDSHEPHMRTLLLGTNYWKSVITFLSRLDGASHE